MEMTNLIIISLSMTEGIFGDGTIIALLLAFLDLNFLFSFYFGYNPYYIEENHSIHESKFTYRLSDLNEVKDLGIRFMNKYD